jgi:hypothetical protein
LNNYIKGAEAAKIETNIETISNIGEEFSFQLMNTEKSLMLIEKKLSLMKK